MGEEEVKKILDALPQYAKDEGYGTASIKDREYQEKIKGIFRVYDEYIKLLAEELEELAPLAYVHGWHSPRVEPGNKLRAEIQSLKDRCLKEKKEEHAGR